MERWKESLSGRKQVDNEVKEEQDLLSSFTGDVKFMHQMVTQGSQCPRQLRQQKGTTRIIRTLSSKCSYPTGKKTF